MNNVSNGKMDDEEDPNLSETDANGSESMSGSVHKNKRHSLMLYSSLHSTAKSSDIDMEENSTEMEQEMPLSASRPTQQSGQLESINEVGERSKDEYVNNSKTNGAVSRRSMRQSKSSMLVSQKSRLFDSNEVMHLMGFDDE